jgi:hypothetical protein
MSPCVPSSKNRQALECSRTSTLRLAVSGSAHQTARIWDVGRAHAERPPTFGARGGGHALANNDKRRLLPNAIRLRGPFGLSAADTVKESRRTPRRTGWPSARGVRRAPTKSALLFPTRSTMLAYRSRPSRAPCRQIARQGGSRHYCGLPAHRENAPSPGRPQPDIVTSRGLRAMPPPTPPQYATRLGLAAPDRRAASGPGLAGRASEDSRRPLSVVDYKVTTRLHSACKV